MSSAEREPAEEDAADFEEPREPLSEAWPPAPDPEPDAPLDAAFARLLAAFRALPGPCAPPVGAGAFDILYASAREVVVWYAPARDGLEQREVAIPTELVRAAWALTLRGGPVDEAALRALATGAAGGRWLLSLLAQAPGVEVRREESAPAASSPPTDGAEESRVTLVWRGERRKRRR